MKFKTVAEAFNHYRNSSVEEIERRAAEIKAEINSNGNADITLLNVEIEGLKQAKENIEEKEEAEEKKEEARGAFNPITGRNFETRSQTLEGDIFSSAEYRTAFYKSMLGQRLDDVETRTMNTAMEKLNMERRLDAFNTTTDSAAVLPTATLNEVISKARTMGGLISHCRQFNMPSNIAIPIGTPSSKAAWHVEGASVDSEKITTASITFAGYEILKIFSMSAATKKMSIAAFESYLVNELTTCVMECIADAIVNGTGVGQGKGVLSGITWDGDNSFTFAKTGSPAYKDFAKMIGMLKRGYGAGAKFAMNNSTLYNLVYSIVDTTGRPIFISDPKNESIGHILGKEVIIDDNIADDTILLGDFKYMGYNIAEGIALETSRESSFKSGLIDYRAMAIADCKPLVEEAFVKLSRALA